jgi:arsenate reductase
MAHGYLQHFAEMSEHEMSEHDTAGRGDSVQVYSAGVAPHGVNPLAVQVMAEDGIDISHHTSNHADEYTDIPFDYVITVCDNAREQCPIFPSTARKIHNSFTDPGHQPGVDPLTSFRQVRDEIKVWSRQFIDDNITNETTHA